MLVKLLSVLLKALHWNAPETGDRCKRLSGGLGEPEDRYRGPRSAQRDAWFPGQSELPPAVAATAR